METWLFFVLLHEQVWRRHYAEERKHPEWFDLGGES